MRVTLNSIALSNYRSCRKTAFAPHPELSVLIGTNGSGKTSILNGIRLLHSLALSQFRQRHRAPSVANEIHLDAQFSFADNRINYSADVSHTTDEDNDEQLLTARESWLIKPPGGESFAAEIPLAHLVDGELENTYRYVGSREEYKKLFMERKRLKETTMDIAVEAIAGLAKSMKYYSASQFTDPSRCPPSFFIEEEGRSHRSFGAHRQHSKFMSDLYSTYKNKSNDWTRFMSIVGKNGIRLVDNIRFKEVDIASSEVTVRSGGKLLKQRKKKRLIIPSFYLRRQRFSPGQLSEGTFKTIGLLFYLLTHKSQLLLIEEPEVCVHHGLLDTIVALIKAESREKQIIISTHSDFVLDKVQPENVFLVRNVGYSGVQVAPISKTLGRDNFLALREFLATSGNLGDYWRQGALENV